MNIASECGKALDRLVVLCHALMNPLPLGKGNASSYFPDGFGSRERLVLRTIADLDAADA